MNVLNFAHGQMYVLGGFVTYTVVAQFQLPFIVGLICSAVALAIVGALVEKYLFRPVIKKSRREESTMLLAAGIAFFLDAVILLVFGEKQRGVPKIIDGVFNWDFIVIMPYDRILIGCLAILMIAAFILFMQFSRAGRAMRALAQDKVAATLMGVAVDRYAMVGFALGAALAGLVGGLLVTITGINLGMGGPASIKAFMMIMIGGAGGHLCGNSRRFYPGNDGERWPHRALGVWRHHLPGDLRNVDGFLVIPAPRSDGQTLGLIA